MRSPKPHGLSIFPLEFPNSKTIWGLPRLQDAIKAQPFRASDLKHALKLAEAAELSKVEGVQTGTCNMVTNNGTIEMI